MEKNLKIPKVQLTDLKRSNQPIYPKTSFEAVLNDLNLNLLQVLDDLKSLINSSDSIGINIADYIPGGVHEGELMPANAPFYYINDGELTIPNHYRTTMYNEDTYLLFCMYHITTDSLTSSAGYISFKFKSIDNNIGWQYDNMYGYVSDSTVPDWILAEFKENNIGINIWEYVDGGVHQGELMPVNAQFYYVNSDGQTIANLHRVIEHEEGEESNIYFVFCLAHLTSGNSSLGYVVFKFEATEEGTGWRYNSELSNNTPNWIISAFGENSINGVDIAEYVGAEDSIIPFATYYYCKYNNVILPMTTVVLPNKWILRINMPEDILYEIRQYTETGWKYETIYSYNVAPDDIKALFNDSMSTQNILHTDGISLELINEVLLNKNVGGYTIELFENPSNIRNGQQPFNIYTNRYFDEYWYQSNKLVFTAVDRKVVVDDKLQTRLTYPDSLYNLYENGEAYYKYNGTWYSQNIKNYIKLGVSGTNETINIGDVLILSESNESIDAESMLDEMIDFSSISISNWLFQAYKVSRGYAGKTDGEFIKFLILNGEIYSANSNPANGGYATQLVSNGKIHSGYTYRVLKENTKYHDKYDYWAGNCTEPGIYTLMTSGRPSGSEDGENYILYVDKDGKQSCQSIRYPEKCFRRDSATSDWEQVKFSDNIPIGEYNANNCTQPGCYLYMTLGRPSGSLNGEKYILYVNSDGAQLCQSTLNPLKWYRRENSTGNWNDISACPTKDVANTINPDNLLETGVYAYEWIKNYSGIVSGIYDIFVEKSTTPDSSGFYSIKQILQARDQNFGYYRTLFAKLDGTKTFNPFIELNPTINISYTQSTENGGQNIITFTKSDGTTQNFYVYNGLKGDTGERGPQGELGDRGELGPKGDRGEQGIQGLPGNPFKIKKTYSSIADMNSDINNIEEGEFVMIASLVNDEDNAKLYVKSNNSFTFIVDLSGALGIAGPTGPQGPKGDLGEQGPKGDLGPKGDVGPAYTLTEEDKQSIANQVPTPELLNHLTYKGTLERGTETEPIDLTTGDYKTGDCYLVPKLKSWVKYYIPVNTSTPKVEQLANNCFLVCFLNSNNIPTWLIFQSGTDLLRESAQATITGLWTFTNNTVFNNIKTNGINTGFVETSTGGILIFDENNNDISGIYYDTNIIENSDKEKGTTLYNGNSKNKLVLNGDGLKYITFDDNLVELTEVDLLKPQTTTEEKETVEMVVTFEDRTEETFYLIKDDTSSVAMEVEFENGYKQTYRVLTK